MPGGIEALELERTPDANNIALAQAPVDATDAAGGTRVRENLRPGRIYETRVTTGMVEVLVRVEDLRNGPALLPRCIEAQAPLQGVYGQGLARLGAGNEVMKVSVRIRRPDTLNQHNRLFPLVALLQRTLNAPDAP
jgi:hypothetical protein